MFKNVVFGAVLCAMTLTTGCSTSHVSPSTPIPGFKLSGLAKGGQQPISGAQILFYAAATTGDAQAASILAQSTTNASGQFSLVGYTCPSASSLVYVVAAGGNPGLPAGANNTAIALMAALGECGSLAASSSVSINEVTTVASVFPLADFAAGYSTIGSGSADLDGLGEAFYEVSELVNTATGNTPGPNLQPGYTSPSATIFTVADILATCVNSQGGTAGDGSPCGSLFKAVTPSGAKPPTDTIGAALMIAQNATANVSAIYNFTPTNGPYQPTLSSPPSSWALTTAPNGPIGIPERANLLGEYLLNEGSGTIAHDSSGNGNDATISGATWDGSADLDFAVEQRYIQLPTALNPTRSWQFAIYSAPVGFEQFPLAPGYYNFPANPSLLCGTDTNHLCLISGTPGRSTEFQAFNTDATQSGVPLPSGWHIVSLLCGSNINGVVTKTHILYDGQEVSSYVRQGDANTCPTPASGNYQVGGSSAYYYTWFLGKVAAVWAWSTPLTLSEGASAASAAMAYIQSKGVVTQFANANNPTPLLIAGLDSRTYGAQLPSTSDAWPFQMALTGPAITRVNLAVPGAYAYDTCVEFSVVYGEQIPASPGQVIIALWGGVNDIIFSNQTSAEIAANLQCLVQQAKAAGVQVILATEISSYNNGDAGKNGLNPIIRANAFSWGVDNLADLATDPHLGADGAYSNTNCFVDGLHPSINCEPYITMIMQDAVNELLGSSASKPNTTATSAYQELAGDRFLTLTSTSAQSVTLPSCIGYSLSRTITNRGTTAASIGTLNGETLSGSSSIATGTQAILSPVPGSVTTGGCSWLQSQ